MSLREDFEQSGIWLFRWRSYLPLALIGILLISLHDFDYLFHSKIVDQIWEMVCLLVSVLGLSIRIITIGHIPKRTSGKNTKQQVADSLNTTGIYSLVRHPLYLGNFFIGLGVALFPGFWWLVIIYILSFWLYYERIMFAEEAFLRNKFGNQYEEWANKIPTFCPKFKNYVPPSLPFSWKTVLKRESNSFFSLILVMFGLEEVSELLLNGKLEFDLQWIIIVSVSIFIWIILRIIKKKTKWLEVDGR